MSGAEWVPNSNQFSSLPSFPTAKSCSPAAVLLSLERQWAYDLRSILERGAGHVYTSCVWAVWGQGLGEPIWEREPEHAQWRFMNGTGLLKCISAPLWDQMLPEGALLVDTARWQSSSHPCRLWHSNPGLGCWSLVVFWLPSLSSFNLSTSLEVEEELLCSRSIGLGAFTLLELGTPCSKKILKQELKYSHSVWGQRPALHATELG